MTGISRSSTPRLRKNSVVFGSKLNRRKTLGKSDSVILPTKVVSRSSTPPPKQIPLRLKASRTHSTGNQNTENTANETIAQYFVISNQFPEFPTKAMRMLFVREGGNMKKIHKFLKNRGWEPQHKNIQLPNYKDIHFATLYHWGKWKLEYEEILLDDPVSYPIGSYFTTFERINGKEPKYCLVFVDQNGYVQQEKIDSPVVPRIHIKVMKLNKPLRRPTHISPKELVSFLP